MTKEEYQTNHGTKLREFLQSPLGQATLIMVNSMRPGVEVSEHLHQHIANREKIIGYDLCLRNLASLSFVPVKSNGPEPDYGVKEERKETEAPKPTFQAPVPVQTQEAV